MSSGTGGSAVASLRHRFPGVRDGWARFDGPAGTQAVDVAITAVAEWMASGNNAAAGGPFAAAEACQQQLDRARAACAQLFNGDPDGFAFGPNMTSMTLAFTRAIALTLRPGDRVVGTMLDHDANVSPWRIACATSGAEHVLAPFDPSVGVLEPADVIALIDERTKWVTVPGASNLLGTAPDLAPIIEAAHAVGARVYVDAVALAPHRAIDIRSLGCDVIVSSPYKWYGPHVGLLYVDPALRSQIPIVKIKASSGVGPAEFETGMPNFEGIAGVEAAARFLMEEGMESVQAAETAVYTPLFDGLRSMRGVTVYGPPDLAQRCPTVAFRVGDVAPASIARALAAEKIAVWDGHNYALNVVATLGLADVGGVVRAGVSRYCDHDDVNRLLRVVERIASKGA